MTTTPPGGWPGNGWPSSSPSVPPAVAVALEESVPRLADLTVIQQGLRAWSESLSPEAGTFMREVEAESERLNASVLGVIVVPR